MIGPAVPRPRHRRGPLTKAAALALTCAVTACAGPAAAPEPAPPVPPGLTVSLRQMRVDELKHVLSVAVGNPGPAPVHIERIQLIAPPLATLPPEPVDTRIGTTPRVDLRIPYGAPRCTGDAPPTPGPAHVLAWIEQAGGTRQVRLPLPHPDPLVTRLVGLECGAQAVRAAADVRLGARWTRRGDALAGDVVMRRKTPGVTVTLHDVGGSVIFGLSPAGPAKKPLAVLGPDRDELTVPVRFTAPNCSAHAMADAKKPYTFPFWAGLPGLERRYLEFEVTPDLRRSLDRLLRETCTDR
ncbi:hypothetical protein DP939_11450 [Spongiactinospora rosea]|uniref:Uncharacterized protein n=1 Tax=Spongiactinospora rosea TaxID=2248750 RepID=A0A366M2I4_9ACTN|nr:hypothetical protein [Spongiactinospora rosea]RBQ20395.1 hypothetical protein DP939_11450 [Spongiactinospora rosea]